MPGTIPELTALSVPTLADVVEALDTDDTTMSPQGSNRSLAIERLLGLAGVLPGGRLTTQSGTPITTGDRTAQGTVYYTPYTSDYVRLYDGTRVKEYVFSERSYALSGLTSGLMYDLFLYDNAGTLTLEQTAWTNNTTRATAIAWQNGLGYVKSGTPTRLYVGSFYTTGTATTEDSYGGTTSQVGGKRFVWNTYNRVERPVAVVDTNNSWSYPTAAIRQANGASGNSVEFILGLTLESVEAFLAGTANIANNVARIARVGIGVDSVTTMSGLRQGAYNGLAAANWFPIAARYEGLLAPGYHFFTWLESGSDGNCSFIGAEAGSQCGLTANVWC